MAAAAQQNPAMQMAMMQAMMSGQMNPAMHMAMMQQMGMNPYGMPGMHGHQKGGPPLPGMPFGGSGTGQKEKHQHRQKRRKDKVKEGAGGEGSSSSSSSSSSGEDSSVEAPPAGAGLFGAMPCGGGPPHPGMVPMPPPPPPPHGLLPDGRPVPHPPHMHEGDGLHGGGGAEFPPGDFGDRGARQPTRHDAFDIADDRGPKPARRSAKLTIEAMIKDYRLSPGCAWMLRALPPDKQKLASRIDPSGQADPSGYVAEQMKSIV